MSILRLNRISNQRDFGWLPTLLADVDEPTLAQIESVLAGDAGRAARLYLTGGEPTLRRDISAILSAVAQRFADRPPVLVTNGRSFFYDDFCAATLGDLPARGLEVEVVIASTRREVHDRTVGVYESFDQASRGIENLLGRDLPTRVRVLVGKHNLEHLYDIAACIPDRFKGIDRIVWDVATLAGPFGHGLGLRPDAIASYLESALNLCKAKGANASVDGMHRCALSDEYGSFIEGWRRGSYRDECTACRARSACAGIASELAEDPTLRLFPVVDVTPADRQAAYEAYMQRFLSRYLGAEAKRPGRVLDAMCGPTFPNLVPLRRFFDLAPAVDAVDIEIDATVAAPPNTHVSCADLRLPLDCVYSVIVIFKPPGDAASGVDQALARLTDALETGGTMMVVLAEHTDVAPIESALAALDLTIRSSQLNQELGREDAEHKWVIVAQRNSAED